MGRSPDTSVRSSAAKDPGQRRGHPALARRRPRTPRPPARRGALPVDERPGARVHRLDQPGPRWARRTSTTTASSGHPRGQLLDQLGGVGPGAQPGVEQDDRRMQGRHPRRRARPRGSPRRRPRGRPRRGSQAAPATNSGSGPRPRSPGRGARRTPAAAAEGPSRRSRRPAAAGRSCSRGGGTPRTRRPESVSRNR